MMKASDEYQKQEALIAELAEQLREARAFLYQNYCGLTDDIIARIDALLAKIALKGVKSRQQ